MQEQYRVRFDRKILGLFRRGLRIGLAKPRFLPLLVRSLHQQTRAVRLRSKYLQSGLEVPPMLIISLTRRCNLNCRGCYSKLLHQSLDEELTASRFAEILAEAEQLGVSIILLAGGEPLLRRDLLEIAARYTRITFPVFTNSTLLDSAYLDFFQSHRHQIPVVSLEGREIETDSRRGDGVFRAFQILTPEFKARGIFWGISLTLTRAAFDLQTSEKFLREYSNLGCRLFFFVEYVPVAAGSEALTLTQIQKEALTPRLKEISRRLPGLFIPFPGDEEQFGGCLAAGRGFLHVSPTGFAEPCPFAPFSDVDLKFSSLRQALASPLLARIRADHHLLKETEGGCALWANREYLAEIRQAGTSR